MNPKPRNVLRLKEALDYAREGKYALGSFSPRYVPMIEPVLRAGESCNSPLIVQISQKELVRYGITPREFANEFYEVLAREQIGVPVVLHLDHTKDIEVIEEAITSGFTSVMIDASEKPFDENIAITKRIVEYAHETGVSVEAELGRIGTTDFVETDTDEELYTNPNEAAQFVAKTNVDALAVSVGTAHGVYQVKRPKIDFSRIEAIRALTPVHLVLHGGSGVPSDMVHQAIRLGVSKVNIATDLEVSLLEALGRTQRLTNKEMEALPQDQLQIGRDAVRATVLDKMRDYLDSLGKAASVLQRL